MLVSAAAGLGAGFGAAARASRRSLTARGCRAPAGAARPFAMRRLLEAVPPAAHGRPCPGRRRAWPLLPSARPYAPGQRFPAPLFSGRRPSAAPLRATCESCLTFAGPRRFVPFRSWLYRRLASAGARAGNLGALARAGSRTPRRPLPIASRIPRHRIASLVRGCGSEPSSAASGARPSRPVGASLTEPFARLKVRGAGAAYHVPWVSWERSIGQPVQARRRSALQDRRAGVASSRRGVVVRGPSTAGAAIRVEVRTRRAGSSASICPR